MNETIGLNEIVLNSKNVWWKMLLGQFNNALVILLLGAVGLSIVIGEKTDAILILAIVILNAFLGFFQEFKAEKALENLKEIASVKCRVIRNGIEEEIDSRFILVGDVVILEEGMKVPADGEMIFGSLEINESILTGESMPVTKGSGFKNGNANVFSGTVVTKGRGKFKVLNIGMQTKFGKIARDLAEVKEEISPLQKKLKKLTWGMMVLGILACGILAFYDGILSGISLAVAVIPEGLPAVLAVTLAFGVSRMAKNKAIVKKMTAVEALGAVNMIATDKTGTVTKNVMEVATTKIVDRNKALLISALCNTSTLVERAENEEYEVIGDQTEGALLKWAQKSRLPVEKIKSETKILAEWLFDSTVRMMTIAIEDKKGEKLVLSKGSVDKIVEKCRGLNERQIKQIWKDHDQMASKGLRIMALGYRAYHDEKEREKVETNLKWVGMVGIADPIREETRTVVEKAEKAGIRIAMITGDNELTARSIAFQAGILKKDQDVLTGAQVDELSDSDLSRHLAHISVFARMRPEQKLRLVKLMQSQGLVTAMTGDGVNDAPALKQADVGVAMGKNGTDVAREAADVVLLDDNLATLVVAVESGRGIIDNLLKTIKYLLTSNLGEVILILGGTVATGTSPLSPIQILWINLVTDGLPAIAMSSQKSARNLMNGKGRQEFLTNNDWLQMMAGGVGLALFAYWAKILWGGVGVFDAIVLGQLLLALVINGKRMNWWLILTILVSGALQFGVTNIEFLARYFG